MELVRFSGEDHGAFEARVVAAAELRPGAKGPAKTALAGADDLCAAIIDDEYRHHLGDLFEALARVDGLIASSDALEEAIRAATSSLLET